MYIISSQGIKLPHAMPYACFDECGNSIIKGTFHEEKLSDQRLEEIFIKSLKEWSCALLDFLDSPNCRKLSFHGLV